MRSGNSGSCPLPSLRRELRFKHGAETKFSGSKSGEGGGSRSQKFLGARHAFLNPLLTCSFSTNALSIAAFFNRLFLLFLPTVVLICPTNDGGAIFLKTNKEKNMWKEFILILTTDSIKLEFPETPTPLLKLLQSPDAGFTASNNNLWWERPSEEEWVKTVSNMAKKYFPDGARINDLRIVPEVSEKALYPTEEVKTRLTVSSDSSGASPREESPVNSLNSANPIRLNELLYYIKQLQEEVAELKKFDAIASEKLAQLNRALESGQQKPKAKTQKSSRQSGKTK